MDYYKNFQFLLYKYFYSSNQLGHTIEYNSLKCYLDIRYCENSNNFMTLSSNSFVDLSTKVGLSNDRNLHGPKFNFFSLNSSVCD